MKVNPSRESAVSLLDSAISRDKFTADFQSSLDTARENLARQRKQEDIEADAMHQAISSAHQVLEDYIRKGPIAHLRERLLEEMGLSEEDVARMPPEQREALEQALAARIKEILLAGTGVTPRKLQAQLMAPEALKP